MGVLDELKQRGAGTAEVAPAAEASQDPSRASVTAALERLYRYFDDLRGQLRQSAPEIRVDYTVEGDTRLTALVQGDYKLGTHEPGSLDRFSFHFTCEAPARREMRVSGREMALAQRDRLREFNLRFLARDIANGGMAFVLESFVAVALDFRRDDERGAVRLVMRNLDKLGSLTYTLPPERVDDELNDELARAVLRKPHRLAELTGHGVSDAARMKIRVMLAEERQQREQEMAGSASQTKRRGLFGRGLFGNR